MTAPISTPFGFESTASEVIAGVDLSGRSAIVTGAASGIGVETARALAAAGATVTMAVRDIAAGERIADELRTSTGNNSIRVGRLDLTDLSSVESFVRDWSGPLHILVNNAGVMALSRAHAVLAWSRAPVRHQPSRPFRTHHGSALRPCRSRRRPRRIGQFVGAPTLPRRFRRHRLRVP